LVVTIVKGIEGHEGNGAHEPPGGMVPPATQVVVEGHEIPSSDCRSAGRFSKVQFAPPFVVVTTVA
jgi:hypothetical protein